MTSITTITLLNVNASSLNNEVSFGLTTTGEIFENVQNRQKISVYPQIGRNKHKRINYVKMGAYRRTVTDLRPIDNFNVHVIG